MRVLAAVLILLAGCATAPQTTVLSQPLSCGSLPYPRPVPAMPVKPINAASHWEFSHDDYVTLRNWFVELDRWLDDTRTLIGSVNQCHEDFNRITKPPGEPKKPWYKRLWD